MQTKKNKIFLAAFAVFVLLLLARKPSYAETCPTIGQNPCWIEKAPMPIPRWAMGAAADPDGKIYVVGGYDGNGVHSYNTVHVYDVNQNTWASKNQAPVEINSQGFSFSKATNKFYMAGGQINNGIIIKNVYEYDPVTDAWIQKNSIPIEIYQFELIENSSGNIYAVGGISPQYCHGRIYEYDPITDAWSHITTMPTQRCDPAAVIDSNGIIYVMGGFQDSRFGFAISNTVEAYNPASNTWSTKSPLSLPRYNTPNSAKLGSNGRIYLVGGQTINQSINRLDNVDEYDPALDVWNSKTSIPIRKDLVQLISTRGKIYALGGKISDSPETATGTNFEGFIPEEDNEDISLNVPLIKQTSDPWKNHIYNSANLWNPADPTISAWGCALTSAAMVFKYNGLNKLPDSKNLDPGTLNSWLKKQKDGYVGNGAVNWLALSRLSKQAKNINGVSFNALEYSRINGNASNELTENLENNIPGILSVPGHFIVAKGTSSNIFSINDPYFSKSSLADYDNTFQNLGTYTPSNTDLSYIMLVADPSINLELLDSNGNSIGTVIMEDSIKNPENPDQNNGSQKILYLQKPGNDNYSIVITSNGEYKVEVYLYDKNGVVFKTTETGILLPEENKTITFSFNGQTGFYPKIKTYLLTTLDIEKLFKQKQISGKNLKRDMEEILARAFVQKVLGNDEKQLKFLMDFEKILYENRGTNITESAYQTLIYDVNYLSSNL